jgi:hypothetical protein
VNLIHGPVVPADHLWLRVCRPDWVDPFDPEFAARTGGRWNPPGSWPTLYLSRNLVTARARVEQLLEGTAVEPDDLTDDSFQLVATRLPRGQVAADVVTGPGIAATGLPPTYPDDGTGERVAHGACWPVADAARQAGLDGVESRSAATRSGAGRELAWWPGDRSPRRRPGRVDYGRWRTSGIDDAEGLFPL